MRAPVFSKVLCKAVPAVFVVGLVLVLTADSADARRRHRVERVPENESYAPLSFEHGRFNRYRNRYHRRGLPTISALVPPDWRKEPPDPNWRGHRYVSPEGDASIALYGRQVEQQSRDQYLKGLAVSDGEDVTYLRRERDWLVAFGSKGDRGERNFYRKIVLACAGKQWRHAAVEYPAIAKRSFERLIEGLSRVMDATTEEGCDATRPSSTELALSAEQMQCVYSRVPKWVKTDLRIRLALGAEVPRNVKLLHFPGETFACNADLTNFRFIVVENDVVIVNPTDYSILEVISP